ncbi:alkaline-phosphatase-like protein, partial [Catenaria anguillulae PL171]
VSDGMGVQSMTLARQFYQYELLGNSKSAMIDDISSTLPLDSLLVGSVRTKPFGQLVTDSAAAATALASGVKTLNSYLGVDKNKKPVANVMEAAKHGKGYLTGLVATSRITHATPGGWSAHILERDWENQVAAQQIGENVLGRSVDLMLGGGLRHFIPKSAKGSDREDERDLIKEATEKYGFKTVVKNRDELLAAKGSGKALPILGLFAKSHLDFEIDRNKTDQPSIGEMSHSALSMLAEASSTCDSPGFFIMIEGSRIDSCGHANDIACHVREIIAYQDAVAIVKSFAEQHPNTMVVSTSDHETGGVSLGTQLDELRDSSDYYDWHRTSAKASGEVVAKKLLKAADTEDLPALVRKLVANDLGVTDVSQAEVDAILKARAGQGKTEEDITEHAVNRLISTRGLIGWTSWGHTGMDVNLYAINAPHLRGNLDNTYLAKYTGEYLGVWGETMDKLSRRLAKQKIDKEEPAVAPAESGNKRSSGHFHH